MRALTQVWVFFVGLFILLLYIGFEAGGRAGLFVAFICCLFVFYATLQKGFHLFPKKLSARELSGNDVSGFLQAIEKNRLKFGFRRVRVWTTEAPTPPLIWKDHRFIGHILLNSSLLQTLREDEVNLLAIFLLCQLENRSFTIMPVLSVLNQSPLAYLLLPQLAAWILTTLIGNQKKILASDKKFKLISQANRFEAGYFLNKLHRLGQNRNEHGVSSYFFSALSSDIDSVRPTFNIYGLPRLQSRLKNLMGFTL